MSPEPQRHSAHPISPASNHVAAPRPTDVPAIVASLRASFDAGRTRPLAFRVAQLDAIARLLRDCEAELTAALHDDLGKPAAEAFTMEVAFLAAEVAHARKHVARWMRPERASTPLPVQPGRSAIVREPLGVVLVLGAWNYPLQLSLGPAIAAIAAGNAVVLKPSELSPRTSRALARAVPAYLDSDAIRVVEGGVEEATALLAERFDHVFYTGNGRVGRVVMEAAARHLTPVTLELGGKSPAIVDADANLDVAARRIAWGKWSNAGQTCVAPDYVLAHRSIKDALVRRLGDVVRDFYGTDPSESPDYGRIVNARHHERLSRLLASGTVVFGGQTDAERRYIAPTLLDDVDAESPVMQEEIFGPILPVLPIEGVDEAIAFVNQREKPLALYVFTESEATADRVISRASSGGVVVNHTLVHLGVPDLPFGGVGPSGMGAYHGRHGFDTFSHKKAVLKKGTLIDPPIMYPPYVSWKTRWLRRILGF